MKDAFFWPGAGSRKGAIKKGTIAVSYPSGATCTVSNGSKVYAAVDTSGAAAFVVEPGPWIVTAIHNNQTASKNVNVMAATWEVVELNFFDGLIYNVGEKGVNILNGGVGTTNSTKWNTSNVTLSSTLAANGKTGSGEWLYTDMLDLSKYDILTVSYSDASAAVRTNAPLMVFAITANTPVFNMDATGVWTLDSVAASTSVNLKTATSGTLSLDISALSHQKKYVVGVAALNSSYNYTSASNCSVNITRIALE